MKFFIIIFLLSANLFSQSVDIELFQKANKLYKQKKYYKAKKIYESLLESSEIDDKQNLLFNLGNSYYYLQKKEQAYNTFKNLISEYPNFKHIKIALLKMVEYLQYKHKYKEAITLLQKYFIQNKDMDIGKKVIKLYKYDKNYSDALLFLDNNFSMSKWYLEQKSLLLEASKEYNKAINLLEKNIKNYDDLKFYQLLSELYEKSGNFSRSAMWYEKAYYKSKNIEYLINEGRMFAVNNKIKDAKKVWNKIFKLYNNNQYSYQIVARVYKEFGLYDDLLKLYTQAEKHGFDFFEDKINILEILGKINDVLDEFIKKINIKNYYSIKDKILQIVFINDELKTVSSYLKYTLNENIKPEFIYPLLIEIYIKYKDSNNILKYFKSYINSNKINYVFVIDLINKINNYSLYKEEEQILHYLKNKKLLNDSLKIKYMEVLYLLNNYDKMIKIANTIHSKSFTKDIAYYKGLGYFKTKQYKKAEKYFRKYKTDFRFFSNLIDVMIYNKQYLQAAALLEKGKKNKKFIQSELLYKESFLNIFLNKTNSILNNFKKILKIYPDSEFANDSGFYIFLYDKYPAKYKLFSDFLKSLYLKNFPAAIKALNKLAEFKKDAIIKLLKAEVYTEKKDYNSAVKELNKINHGYILPYAMELKGDIYIKYLNDKIRAVAIYKKIINDYPGYVNIQDVRNKILNN